MDPGEIEARYGWQPGEREAVAAEIAERQRRIKSDEMLAWCRARNEENAAERAQAEPLSIERSTEAAKPMTQPTDGWVRYIKQQLDKRERLMADCVGEALAGVEEKHKAQLDEVRAEVTALKGQLAELRAEAKVRGTIDDLQARLDRIEQARPPLRTVGKALTA